MKHLACFFLCLFLYTSLNAQDQLPVILETDFSGIKINRTEYYDGNSLWGYIDGGADLYLEYGFSKLAAQEILFKTGRYKIDIYKMNNAEAAFGIFSITKFKCSDKSIGKYSCVTEYQITAAKGSYYISVTNEKGSAEEQKFMFNLAEKVLSRIIGKEYEIPKQFTKEPYVNGEVKFINGILGVQNGVSDWETIFSGLGKFSFTLYNIEENGSYTMTALIKFADADDITKFSKAGSSRTADGVKLSYTTISETEILFTETNKK